MSTALLLAQPEPDVRGYLERQLTSDGFDVIDAPPDGDVLELAERARPALLLLDADSLELCLRLRRGEPGRTWDRDVPVILIGRDEADPVDRVRAFDRGVDDYVAQPLVYGELLARIRAVLRRTAPPGRDVYEAAELRLDRTTRQVRVGETPVRLSAKEFDLLARLASDPQRVFEKDELLREIWGIRNEAVRTRTVDSHASRLRRKLCAVSETAFVVNVWGVGYRLIE